MLTSTTKDFIIPRRQTTLCQEGNDLSRCKCSCVRDNSDNVQDVYMSESYWCAETAAPTRLAPPTVYSPLSGCA